MSKNFDGIQSPFAENYEAPKMETPSKASEGELKSNFENSSEVKSPFVDEIANPKGTVYKG